jgi:hypothetical protein
MTFPRATPGEAIDRIDKITEELSVKEVGGRSRDLSGFHAAFVTQPKRM